MNIQCGTKGCNQMTEAKLDKEKNVVICEACGNPIEGVTEYTKRVLLQQGQIVRGKNKEPFQTFCKTCNANVNFFMDSGKAYCSKCQTQLLISKAFQVGFEQHLEAKKKEELAEKVEEVPEIKPTKKAKKEVK